MPGVDAPDAASREHFSDSSDSDDDGDRMSEYGSEGDEENQLAEQVASLVYDNSSKEQEINYDHFQFAVAQKFDFSTRNLTYKKAKYISDEVFLDLKWRMRHTI